nr:immunoglobulin light chain junction region [Macaca mulatta]
DYHCYSTEASGNRGFF